VFKTDTEFISYVRETIDLNLSDIQKALVYIAAHEKMERFSEAQIIGKLREYLELLENPAHMADEHVRLDLELLLITGVIKRTAKGDEYFFSHPHYVEALKEIERLDKDAVTRLLAKVSEQNGKAV
jgi:hypothetical protein